MSLRKQLIRLAHSNETLRPHLLAMLKSAVSDETADFIEWALNTQDPLPESAIRKFIEGPLHMEIKPPIQKRTGPRFQIGDMVEITASKHKDPETKGVYDMYNGRVGEVVAVNGMDADVRMESGSREVITFPKAQSPRGVGIYKYTAPFELEGSAAIEMVYLAGGEVTDEQKVVVEAYKARGRNHEKRPGYYYSGHAFTARLNAAGQVYFGMNPQQRLRVDIAEGGFMARSFNPSKGDVIYIGLVGRRPTSWKSELDAIRTESMAAAK